MRVPRSVPIFTIGLCGRFVNRFSSDSAGFHGLIRVLCHFQRFLGDFGAEDTEAISLLKQFEKVSDRHSLAPDKSTERTDRQFFVLRDGKVCTLACLRHDQMAAHLPDCMPTCLCEGLCASFPEMLASVPIHRG
jgi:hypothetical protein